MTAAQNYNTINGYGSTPPDAIIAGQAKIAVTNTSVQLPANILLRGVTVYAKFGNNDTGIFIGPTSAVTTTYTGAGNGFPLLAGQSIFIATNNTSDIWINGTAGDIVSFIGS